jgi:hypothetical protein
MSLDTAHKALALCGVYWFVENRHGEHSMDEFAKHIERTMEERGFCVVLEHELEHCWPSEKIDRGDREEQIQSFAESHGWIVFILNTDSGVMRAIFERNSPSAAPY